EQKAAEEKPASETQSAPETTTTDAAAKAGEGGAPSPQDAPVSMESLMASHDAYEESFRELKRGEFLTGRVIQINDEGAMVDVGYKTEGFIPVNQMTHRKDADPREL